MYATKRQPDTRLTTVFLTDAMATCEFVRVSEGQDLQPRAAWATRWGNS